MKMRNTFIVLALLGLAVGSSRAALKSVLIYSMTAGFRHDGAIKVGNDLIDTLGKKNGFTVFRTEDPNVMTYTTMKKYDVLLFNNTTGPVLPTAAQQADFVKYLSEGGGWVGFHGAMDSHGYWDWWSNEGVDFGGHTSGTANCRLDTAAAIKKPEYRDIVKIFSALGPNWEWDEEWYAFKQNPRRNSDILITVDEKSPKWNITDPSQRMVDHAVAWAHKLAPLAGSTKQGHYFYTSLGHGQGGVFKSEKYVNDLVYQGLRWAAGEMDGALPEAIQESNVVFETETRAISAMPARIDVSVSQTGPHQVDILNLQGRRVGGGNDSHPRTYTFGNLPRGSIYLVRIKAAKQTISRRVFVP